MLENQFCRRLQHFMSLIFWEVRLKRHWGITNIGLKIISDNLFLCKENEQFYYSHVSTLLSYSMPFQYVKISFQKFNIQVEYFTI